MSSHQPPGMDVHGVPEETLIVLPGCHKCEHAMQHLRNRGIPFTAVTVFEEPQLLRQIPPESRSEGMPLFYRDETYYTYRNIILM
ncbi:hypothetical protein [Alteribacter natronophilus]|uniref:hypothetical protein n=1 Tax=Alteribacter natronophilus TaxID=2583810 RepID=UPI00110E065B|nr:hypothetical protein [Alteribacter natronophilus]TMW72748.1 hypothetical protein FGB90_00085 [Alteribacter natronophilus]